MQIKDYSQIRFFEPEPTMSEKEFHHLVIVLVRRRALLEKYTINITIKFITKKNFAKNQLEYKMNYMSRIKNN